MTFRLQEFREAAGLSRKDLAQRANVSEKTVANIENGVHSPTITTAAKLSIALDVPITTLLDEPART